MQKKLLYSSVLCALFGISGIIFGMEKDSAGAYTLLTLQKNGIFGVCSPSGIFKQNKNEFEKNWTERGFQQYANQPDFLQNSFNLKISTFDLRPSQLIITSKNDIKTLSVITGNNNKSINLGDFEKAYIEYLEYFYMQEGKIELFRTGIYYPINKIIHNDNINNSIEIIDVKSIDPSRINTIENNKEIPSIIDVNSIATESKTPESKIRPNSWKKNILLIGGVSILVLAYFFPDRFTQFFQSFKNAELIVK
jgi:hypothetical protein